MAYIYKGVFNSMWNVQHARNWNDWSSSFTSRISCSHPPRSVITSIKLPVTVQNNSNHILVLFMTLVMKSGWLWGLISTSWRTRLLLIVLGYLSLNTSAPLSSNAMSPLCLSSLRWPGSHADHNLTRSACVLYRTSSVQYCISLVSLFLHVIRVKFDVLDAGKRLPSRSVWLT